MARPQKEGLDYFPLNCQFSDSVKLLQAEFGPAGVGILVTLWQRIYGGKGYYTAWDNDVALMFAKENGTGVNVVREVISACLRRGIFDREKFEKYNILTSAGIQERYAEATERRTFQKIDGRYLLISMPSNWVIVDNNSVNADNNAVNVCKSTQSKVNKSKVNKSIAKEKETALPTYVSDTLVLHFSDGDLPLSLDRQNEYIERYKNIDVPVELTKMRHWLSTTKKQIPTLSDANHFINKWLKGTNEENSVPKSEYTPSHSADDFFKAAVAKSMGNTN